MAATNATLTNEVGMGMGGLPQLGNKLMLVAGIALSLIHI